MLSSIAKMLLAAFTLLVPPLFSQQSHPDLILVNGKVFTGTTSHPYVEALAIRGERIIAVGTTTEIAALAGKETKRIAVETWGERLRLRSMSAIGQELAIGRPLIGIDLQGSEIRQLTARAAV